MSNRFDRKLRRFQVGGLPLIEAILQRIRLREILTDFITPSPRELISSVDSLILLAVNMTLAKDPLYELAEWADSLDLRALGFRTRPTSRFTDDRMARALDKLFEADRACLLTRLAVAAIEAFDVRLDRIHNDSTSVKACGHIPGRSRTGFELRRGHSKDHRPDLKQLVYTLSVSADGAVPIHHHVYPGNRNDDTTHIETWEALCRIHGAADFLYVADCKLCTQKQLAHIVDHEGRAITILPQNFVEVRRFKDELRAAAKAKRILWRRSKPGYPSTQEVFYLFDGDFRTDERAFPIYWFLSTEKRQRDRRSRQERLEAAVTALKELAPRINRGHLKRKAQILSAATDILEHYHVDGLLDVSVQTHMKRLRQRRRGRPAKNFKQPWHNRYRYRCQVHFSLHWTRNVQALEEEARTDGVFPLLCTDPSVPPKSVLVAYKFQPRLEKRFCQFKSIHLAAPLLFKKVERVEANMFVFFIALLIQALLERLLRQRVAERNAKPLKLYPEDRDAPHPTTSQLLKTFDGLCTYTITEAGRVCERYHDELNPTHRAILALLDMPEQSFWNLD